MKSPETKPAIKAGLIPLLQRLQGWRLSVIVALGTVLAVELIVSAMGLILNGEVPLDYLLTGFVAAGIVAPLSLMLLSFLLQELAQQQQQVLSNNVERAERRLRVALDSTDEGILMVADDGQVLSTNKRFLELWRVPQALAEAGQDAPLLAHVLDQLVNPDNFMDKVQRLYHSHEEARDTLGFKDGRVFARYTRALSFGSEHGRIWCFRDITEQAQAQAALAEREAIYRTILDNVDASIYLKDTKGCYLFANRAVRELWQVDMDGIVGFGDEKFFDAATTDNIRKNDRRVLAGGETLKAEEVNTVPATGTTTVFQSTKLPLRHADGSIYALCGISMDITARRQAELALAEREAQLRTLIEAVPDTVQFKDGDGRWLVANNVCLRLFGLERLAWQNRSDSQIGSLYPHLATEMAACRRSDEAAWTSGEAILRSEECVVDGQGNPLYFDMIKVPLFDAQHQRHALVIVGRDISERKRAERNLNMAVEVAQLVLWELDFVSQRLLYEQALLSRLGLDVEQAPGSLHEWIERVHPDDLASFQAQVAQALKPDGSVFDMEYRMAGKAGEFQWIHSRARIVQRGPDGQALLAVGTSMNITARKAIEEAVRISEEQSRNLASMLRLMCDNVPDMIWAKDLNKRYIFANRAICAQLLNASDTDEPLGKTDLFFAQRERAACPDRPQWHTFGELCQDSDTLTLERGGPSVFEEFGNVKGKLLYLDVHKAPFVDNNGTVIGTVGSARDITLRKQEQEQLLLSASVFSHAREGIMITAADGTIIEVNAAFSHITGYARDEVLGQNSRLLKSDRQDNDFYAALWRSLHEKGHWYGEIWNRRKNGDVYPEMQTISAVRDASGAVLQYVALFSDITALKEHERQLEHIAHYDVLTTLPNRVLFADRLHQAMVQAQRRGQLLAVAYLDLDGFKAINDRHGHDAGDQLLVTLSAHMKESLREGDTLARLGGDEFVAVLIDLADVAASTLMLGRLLDAAALPVQRGDYTLQVSASIGVTYYPQATEVDADQLLRQSDQAMYKAKLAGKNRYHIFDAEQDNNLRGHHESLERIRRALTEQEFVLHYQPKVNMRTGQVIGTEALIRWQHPEKGLLPPAQFLPVIEDHPLAVDIGEWVIASALNQMAQWRKAGLNIPVSVNVGARQLQQANFVERLRALLAAHPEQRPGDLELEVLETSALEDLARVSRIIEFCRELGMKFALDDFGTGYSSLTYLKRLPVSQLKIDQSFVRDMLDDPDDLAILEGVIGLSRAFDREVIAEGVETVEHGEMLLQLGCELAQGFGIARPMPGTDVPAWAATWHPDPVWLDHACVNRDDLPLLFAGVEHRAWIVAFEAFIQGEREAAPPDEQLCRFGRWLNGECQVRHGQQPTFQAIERLHRQVHLLADKMLQLHASGCNPAALACLPELHALRDSLAVQLKALLHHCRQQR
ncbi:MAG: EAL domain-containing protein [Comamonadaceae bacterium]|nr:EAL domain-containing protein [Comamonadaceae bacterium]